MTSRGRGKGAGVLSGGIVGVSNGGSTTLGVGGTARGPTMRGNDASVGDCCSVALSAYGRGKGAVVLSGCSVGVLSGGSANVSNGSSAALCVVRGVDVSGGGNVAMGVGGRGKGAAVGGGAPTISCLLHKSISNPYPFLN
ncbi:unnamed protein product [Ilex paraguariensis]|uniref:Uncharacterized protein n=1 Tax=Ilex paraguariensis TaxID=185542 RepID=A0ABC8SP37_9AQUA